MPVPRLSGKGDKERKQRQRSERGNSPNCRAFLPITPAIQELEGSSAQREQPAVLKTGMLLEREKPSDGVAWAPTQPGARQRELDSLRRSDTRDGPDLQSLAQPDPAQTWTGCRLWPRRAWGSRLLPARCQSCVTGNPSRACTSPGSGLRSRRACLSPAFSARGSPCKRNLKSCPNFSGNAWCFRSLSSRRSEPAGPGPSPAPTAPFSCARKGRTGCIRTIVLERLCARLCRGSSAPLAQGQPSLKLQPHGNTGSGSQCSKAKEILALSSK